MPVLFGYHEACEGHDPGVGHPERAARLDAVLRGLERSGAADDVVSFAPRRATNTELTAVHTLAYVEDVAVACCESLTLDPDTHVVPSSHEAALRAAGAGLDAADRLSSGAADSAFLALRPPGHHALGAAAMGFCLFNNVAVTAAGLVARGERVLILDWDAHHGNGTQAAFYENPDVLFVSLHQFPAYPGTGSLAEYGAGAGVGTTVNLPFPAGTAGDAYRLAFDEVLVPIVEVFSPSWLLVSAGYDAHRADPITDLGLSSGDFADLTERAMRLVPPGRRIFFLEGGYDLEALADSVAATIGSLAGRPVRPEPVTSGGALGARPGSGPAAVVDAARAVHVRAVGS